VKKFGIYVAYPPEVDLRAEGLGRYLAEFLNAARDRTDARFVIACPSWTIKSLHELFERAGIPAKAFEIISPKTEPVILRFYRTYQSYKRRRRKRYFLRVVVYLRALKGRLTTRAEKTLATARSPLFLSFLILLATPILGIMYFVYLLGIRLLLFVMLAGLKWIWWPVTRSFDNLANRLTLKPQGNPTTVRLYRFMEEAEAKLLCDQINARKDISAWYAPTAFWPHFNQINAPRLTCVPDVLLAEFPAAFSLISSETLLEAFKSIERTIEGGDRFVTYSDEIKYRTLVARYRVAPDSIAVVRHGVNRLDDLVTVSGFPDTEAATDGFCKGLFRLALRKAVGTTNATNFDSGDVQFIFYATQFRPNKNIISLLRAYEYLLRRRYIGHKLVLTGNPKNISDIALFIKHYNLQNDVLCLNELSARELAACYRLADLVVNPSLSEGGCPFTLTEALSVGTPVVMARIAVTVEVVTDPELQKLMLFDPNHWEDIAARIEWGLNNRNFLLERQLELYEKLSQRTWGTVVDEHIAILDRISGPAARIEDRS
jgi:glycosyltransferase involved in cell wall biosynthesis